MKSLTSNKTMLFVLIVGLFLMQDQLQDWFAPFQYFDEAFAFLFLPLLLLRILQKRNPLTWTRYTVLFSVLLAFFWLSGWAGFFVYRYQSLTQAAKDSFVNIKFFMASATAFLIFFDKKMDIKQFQAKLWPVLNAVTIALFALCLIDLLFGIFPSDLRGTFRAIKLFYSTYTVLVGHCVFLGAIYLWYYDVQKRKIIPYLVMLSLIIYFTRRAKGIGAIACIVFIYLLILRRQYKIGRKAKIFLGCVLVFAAAAAVYQFVYYYYVAGTQSARAMLTLAAPFVAWDHFPFGSGWATFGSAFSVDPYSPVYGMYRMAGIWGLSPDYPAFVSDTYWPMLLGQCGYFGFAAFIGALVLFVKKVLSLKSHPASYASGLAVLLYLLISSTSESALANPIAVPMAFWIGFLLATHRASEKETTKSCVIR